MRSLLSWVLVALLIGSWSPLVRAQDEESSETDTTGESGDSSEEEADPWAAPTTDETTTEGEGTEETTEGEGEETTPSVVTPSAYPTAEIDRPLALPKMTLEPYGSFGLIHFGDNIISLSFGAAFGIIDNLEAGIGGYSILPMWGSGFPVVLSPDFDVGDMGLYGLYELDPMMDGKLRLAGRLTLNMPLQTDFAFILDAPVKFKLHEMFAAVGGVGLGLALPEDNTTFLLLFDFGTLVQPVEALALSLMLGVHVGIAEDTMTLIPLTFRGQFTLIGDLDAFLEFGFGDLKEAGADWIVFILGAAYRLPL
jgi:hypothetical protein